MAQISTAMILGGVILPAVAMLRTATAPRPAIGPPQPGVLILLLVTFGIASIWLGYIVLQADCQP